MADAPSHLLVFLREFLSSWGRVTHQDLDSQGFGLGSELELWDKVHAPQLSHTHPNIKVALYL